jgi:hypothetical protein
MSDRYTFVAKVVGVSFANDDGSERQAIIKQHVKPGKAVYFYHEPSEYSQTAVGVYISTGPRSDQIAQIGNIADTTTKQYGFYKRVAAGRITGQVIEVKGEPDQTLGVIVGIIAGHQDPKQERRAETPVVSLAERETTRAARHTSPPKPGRRRRNYIIAAALALLLVCACLLLLA